MRHTAGALGIEPRALSSRVSWWFLVAGIGCSVLAAVSPSESLNAFLFDAIALSAAGAAAYGSLRNQPARRGPWLLVAAAIALTAAGDVVYDIMLRRFGAESGYPYADLLYLTAYPCLAIALWQITARGRRETTVDNAIVALAASAVIWQWVITPVLSSSRGAALEVLVTVAYPIMDIVLVVAIVHAVFLLPRWITAARFLFVGLTVMLVADAVFARLVADGNYAAGGPIDALWPIAYTFLAGAVLHPSMRELWDTSEAGLVRTGRARIAVLATAIFSAPAILVIDGATSGEALALTVMVAATAALLAWRIARLVADTNQAREEIGVSEARFRALVQHSTDAVAVIARDGSITYVAESIRGVLGYEPSALVGRPVRDLMHPGDLKSSVDALVRLAAQPLATEQLELRARHADGSWRWLDATCTNQLEEPSIRGIVGNFRDITNRKRSERHSASETRVLELILSGTPVPETLHELLAAVESFVVDGGAAVRLLDSETGGLSSVAAPTLPLAYMRALDSGLGGAVLDSPTIAHMLAVPVVVADLREQKGFPELRSFALAHGLRSLWTLPIRTPDGAEPLGHLAVYTRTVRVPTTDEHAILERAVDIISLALDRAARTEQLGFLALHDALTGLPNRALAVERLDRTLDALPDTGPSVAVLFLDLDRFKVVNDGLGHDTGDELLVAVGRRLQAAVRGQDTVARLGGDEFVVICGNLHDQSQAMELADRALHAFVRPFSLARAEVVVSGSIGIAIADHSSARATSLLRDADAAMYRAKSRGGARYELFDEAMHTQAMTRLLTERGLRQSLDHDELRMLFQPQFELATCERVATEALLRWEHPVRGTISPGEFIAVAEESGLIVPIGEWVIDEVCGHIALTWREDPADARLPVSMNVAARQLLQPRFVDHVRRALTDRDLDASALCIEVAERVLLDDQEPIRDALHALKDLGIRLAIDDFGTGGSSLTHLRRYPFVELKIDGTFVAGLGRSAADDAIVAATIDMAHALGMTVAAEGIETEAQLARLVDLGCERGQGYLLAPPEEATVRHLRLVHRHTA